MHFPNIQGHVYNQHLAQELLTLPENSLIKYSASPQTPYIHKTLIPTLDASGKLSFSNSNKEDYENELKEYVKEPDEGTKNEFSFEIFSLRPSEIVWLDKVLLIKPVDKRIVIQYHLKSKNTTGNISGELYYEQNH